MSSSLSAQRDRIQKQIQELEQNLCVSNADLELMSSDSDEESDADEEAEQTPAGLLAQREKIQKQIENLENVLGTHSPEPDDDDEDDSSSDESELSLPQSVDVCLQMNLVYQQVVQETLNQLEDLLKNNLHQQKELLSQLSGPIREPPREEPASSSHLQPNVYLGHFLKPYFKDKVTGLGPPANQETKEKFSRMTGGLDDKKMKLKRWEPWQKTLLIHSVNSDYLKRMIQPKLARLEYMSQKISLAQEPEKELLKEHVERLEKEVELLRGKKDTELIGDRYEEHDWQKIANIDFEGTRDAEDIRCFWQNFLHPSIKKSSWKQEEVQQLKEVSRRHEDRNWEEIAQELGTGRTAFMCLQTFQRFVSDSFKRRSWTKDEDSLLRELVNRMRIGNFIPYTQISYFMEGREPVQLIYRWNQVLDPSIKKGPWSQKEDALLLRAVARHGERFWWKIRLEVPGRTDNSCRDRYYDTLKGVVKRGGFDQQEKELLLKLVEKHGVGRWAKIAAEIPNRSDAQCLREWKKELRRRGLGSAQQTNTEKKQGGARKKTAVRRRPIRRKPIPIEEEEAEFTEGEEEEEEEEEEEVVQYMDSDEEEKKKRRKRSQRKEGGAENSKGQEQEQVQKKDQGEERKEEQQEEEEDSFPPMEEWIPSEKIQPLPFPLVTAPPPGATPSTDLIRCTILSQSGRSVVMGPKPRVLPWVERHSSIAMVMVTPGQLQKHLDQRPGPKRGTITRRKRQWVSPQQLQAAVVPWVGHLLIPARTKQTVADVLRERECRTRPSSTDIFKLLLQTMKVDTTGSKIIIESRMKRDLALPTPPTANVSTDKPMTVSRALQLKREAQQLHQDTPQHILGPHPHHLAPPPQLVFLPPPVLQVAPPSSSPHRISSSPIPSSVSIGLQLAGPPTLNVAPPPAILQPVFIGSTLASGKAVSTNLTRTTSSHYDNSLQAPLIAQNIPLPQTFIFCPSSSSSLATPLPAPPTPTQTGHSSSPNPQTPASIQKCPPLKDHDYTFFELDPTHGNQHTDSTPKYVNGTQVIPDSGSCSPVESRTCKRKLSEGGAHAEVGQADLNMGGACSVTESESVIRSGKRIRKPSQRVKDMKEVEVNLKAQRCSSSSRQTPRSPRRSKVSSHPRTRPVALAPQPSPAQSGWVMTPGGQVQLTGLKPPPLLTSAPPLAVPTVSALAPPPAATPPLRTQARTFDPSLMFLGPNVAVCDWFHGKGGVAVPGLGVALPYLPPFVSSLSTLSVLLRAKTSLVKSSIKLLSHSSTRQSKQTTNQRPDSTSDVKLGSSQEVEDVSAVRQLVAERFADNPAYQLLKARFLSAFTLPALLATLEPINVKTEPSSASEGEEEEEQEEEEQEEQEEKEEVEKEEERIYQIKTRGQRKRKGSPLQCDASELSNQLSGISSNLSSTNQNI